MIPFFQLSNTRRKSMALFIFAIISFQCLIIFADYCWAYDDEAMATYEKIKTCTNCDLSSVQLAKIRLPDPYFTWLNLALKPIFIVDYQNSSLHKANLQNANLNLVDLSNSDLSNANLRGAELTCVQLTGANLEYANLEATKMWNAQLNQTNLFASNLYNSYLRRSNLQAAKLERANLMKADLSIANLDKTNF